MPEGFKLSVGIHPKHTISDRYRDDLLPILHHGAAEGKLSAIGETGMSCFV